MSEKPNEEDWMNKAIGILEELTNVVSPIYRKDIEKFLSEYFDALEKEPNIDEEPFVRSSMELW